MLNAKIHIGVYIYRAIVQQTIEFVIFSKINTMLLNFTTEQI